MVDQSRGSDPNQGEEGIPIRGTSGCQAWLLESGRGEKVNTQEDWPAGSVRA